MLLIVFVVALAMRLADVWGQAHENPYFHEPTMDEGMHHQWAQQIASGEGLGDKPYFRAPLYYLLLGGLYAIAGPNTALAHLCGALLGSATCVLVALLGLLLANRATGLLAGLLTAVYWPLVFFDNLLLTVGLEIFLNVALLVLLLLALRRRQLLLFAAAGVVWGLAALTRPNVLALAPAIAAWIALAAAGWSWRRRIGAIAITGAAALLTILPVTIRNRVVGGEWVLIATNAGVNFYIGNNPLADGEAAIVPGTRRDWQGGYEDTHRFAEAAAGRPLSEREVSEYWFQRGLAWIRAEPGAWLRLTWHKLRLFWSGYEISNNLPVWFFARLSPLSWLYWLSFTVVAPLGLAGLMLLRRHEWRVWSLPILYLVVTMATVVIFFAPARYRLPVVPILILLAAFGLVRLVEVVRRRRWGRLSLYGLLVIAAAMFVISNPPDHVDARKADTGQGHAMLGLWFLQNSREAPELLLAAREHLSDAVALRPYDARVRMLLGGVLYELGQVDAANAQFDAALATAPDEFENQFAYAMMQRMQGRSDAAIAALERSLALQPEQVEAHAHLGELLAAQGRDAAAAAAFRAALRRAPDDARALAGLRRLEAEAATQPRR